MRYMPLPLAIRTLQTDPYRVLEAPDASSFLRALSPIDSPIDGFGDKLPKRSLIYRGLSSSDLELVPKSRRKNVWPYRGGGGEDTWKNRLIAEAQTVLSFSELADRQGLPIPNMMALRRNLHLQIGPLSAGI